MLGLPMVENAVSLNNLQEHKGFIHFIKEKTRSSQLDEPNSLDFVKAILLKVGEVVCTYAGFYRT